MTYKEFNCVNTLRTYIAPLLLSAQISNDNRIVKVRPGKVKDSNGNDASLYYFDKEASVNGFRTVSNSVMRDLIRIDDVMKVVKYMRDKLEYENVRSGGSGCPRLVTRVETKSLLLYMLYAGCDFDTGLTLEKASTLKWNDKRKIFEKVRILMKKTEELGLIVKEEEEFYGLKPEYSPYNSITRIAGYYEAIAFSMAQNNVFGDKEAAEWMYRFPYLQEWKIPILLSRESIHYMDDPFYVKAFVFDWLCRNTNLDYETPFAIDVDKILSEIKKTGNSASKKSVTDIVSKMMYHKYIYMEKSGKNVKWSEPVFKFMPPEKGVCITNYKFMFDDEDSTYISSGIED